jgi:hypothetical protein
MPGHRSSLLFFVVAGVPRNAFERAIGKLFTDSVTAALSAGMADGGQA